MNKEKTNIPYFGKDLNPADTYNSKDSFSKFIKKKRYDFAENTHEEMPTKKLAERLGLSHDSLRKILSNNDKRNYNNRDCIIAICILLQMSLEETNHALKLYNDMSPLIEDLDNKFNSRDNKLIEILRRQSSDPLSISKINAILLNNHFTELDYIIHSKVKAKYEIVERKQSISRTRFDLQRYYEDRGFAYCYDPSVYSFYSTMTIKQLVDDVHFELVLEENGNYVVYNLSEKKGRRWHSITETGDFAEYFKELEIQSQSQLKKLTDILFDTRNYNSRVSARVIDSKIHVFIEEYNHWFPELQEYFLLDYSEGVYTFYISDKSLFMSYHLTKDDYEKYYKEYIPIVKETYTTPDAMKEIRKHSTGDDWEIIDSRICGYSRLHKQLEEWINRMKKREVLIVDPNEVYQEFLYDVIKFYELENEFKCIYDDEVGEIIGTENETIPLMNNKEEQININLVY